MTKPPESAEVFIVLAAGKGTRADGPKALRTVNGQPWWRWQQERLRGTAIGAIWVVSPVVGESMRAHRDCPESMIGASPDAPMFASIVAGLLGAAPFGAAYVLPVDVPAPSRATCAALAVSDHFPTIATHKGQRGHPVRLPWEWVSRTLLPRASDALWVARSRLDDLTVQRLEIEVDDPEVIVDLDTPADFELWGASHRH